MTLKIKKPKCFGNQDALVLPCTPKRLGGKGMKCKFMEKCYKKTIKNLVKFAEEGYYDS